MVDAYNDLGAVSAAGKERSCDCHDHRHVRIANTIVTLDQRLVGPSERYVRGVGRERGAVGEQDQRAVERRVATAELSKADVERRPRNKATAHDLLTGLISEHGTLERVRRLPADRETTDERPTVGTTSPNRIDGHTRREAA
jgi:hypothetical protein